ncbi:MAG TPA: endolytic transglycosylase MltG [Gammaproteobacteria bacterium]|nr:endolytic transglycosylase MltG [Gammaproteobacteria bacterium]
MKLRTRLLIWVFLAALLAATGAAGYVAWRLTVAPLPASATGVTFVVKHGDSVKSVARRLEARGAISHGWELSLLARLRGEGGNVRAGEYRIPAGLSVAGLLDMLVSGRVVMHSFTIVPGTTFHEIRTQLEADSAFDDDIKGLTSAQVMKLTGHPGETAEGHFLPNTYDFPKGTKDSAVLARAYAAMHAEMAKLWPQRAVGLPYKAPEQALIIASIVEKETALPRERPRIAGVFVRRLQKGMRLAADPTVIYGLGSRYNGDITRRDLHLDTPYNTYLHRGYPPTPICMPSLASIRAALHPDHGKSLYFVAKGDGSHVFSDTLAEQEKMIEKYQLHKGGGSKHQ